MYFLNDTSTVQIIDVNNNLANVSKYELTDSQIDVSLSSSIKLIANVNYTIPVSFTKLCLLQIKSLGAGTFDLALNNAQGTSTPKFLGLPSNFTKLVNPTGQPFQFITLLSTTTHVVEVVVGGLL
jgi:hypothetical protein